MARQEASASADGTVVRAVSRPSAAVSPRAAAAASAVVLLLLVAPAPAAAVRAVSAAGPVADPTAPVVALTSLLAWGLTGWLLLSLALTVAADLPGLLGAVAGALVRRITPAALRRSLELLLGVSVAVGPLGQLSATASAAAAATRSGTAGPAVPEANLDWPTPAAPSPAAAAPDARPPQEQPQPVLVHPGDSLWRIAERDLVQQGRPASHAAVARSWPAWWSANRAAVGDDPHLIRPGMHLRPPTARRS